MMKATLLLRRKVIYKDGRILEMVVWKLPTANQERRNTHRRFSK